MQSGPKKILRKLFMSVSICSTQLEKHLVRCLFKFSPAQTCVPGQKTPLASYIAQLSPPPMLHLPEEARLRQNHLM